VGELGIHPVKEHYLVYMPTVLKANGFKIQQQLKEVVNKLEREAIEELWH